MKLQMIFLSLSLAFLLSCNGEQRDRSEEQGNNSPNMMQGNSMQEDNGGMMGEGGMMGNGGMMGDSDMMQDGMMSEEMRKAMMSRGMGPEMMEDMQPIHQLLMNHEQIERRVEDLDNGVKTWTTSDDPEIAATIQKHVRQMKERVEEKKPIRQMDPLFREIFDHADQIDMQIEDLENGVVVTETSQDPQVVKLIQQHAHRAVSEFVNRGMERAMQPTPLPEGYKE